MSQKLTDYLALTKPMIMVTVALTTLGGYYISSPQGSLGGSFIVVLGVVLTAAGSAAWNQVLDRDSDAKMHRTQNRPIPAGRISERWAMVFATVLSLAGLALLGRVNGTALGLGLLAWGTYILIYTAWLKRRSPFAAVPGGIAGALPPLIGSVAATGRVTIEGLLLFSIMFIWQPAHFWYLALRYQKEYQQGGIPVLPLSHGDAYTRWHALLYVLCLFPLCLLPYGLGFVGVVYLCLAGTMTLFFVLLNIDYVLRKGQGSSLPLFFTSILHLVVVFTALVVDRVR